LEIILIKDNKDNGIQLSYLVAGFSLVTASRPERSAGGVVNYLRNNLEFYDSIIIAIEVKGRGKTFDVACIHRTPRREQPDVNTFLVKLDEFLTDLKDDSILVGNFNFNLNTSNSTSMYLDLIRSHSFFICNENTTSMATQSASLIGHVMVNYLSKRIDITHMPFRNLDHELLFVEVYHTKYLTAKTSLMKIGSVIKNLKNTTSVGHDRLKVSTLKA
jgi:hypothetical protein